MLILIYFAAWILIALMLGRLGLSLSSIEGWIILLSVAVIVMVKERLYEKDIINQREKYKNGL